MDPSAVMADYRRLQGTPKRDLLGLHRALFGPSTPERSYKHALIGDLITHHHGPQALAVVRERRQP